MKKIEVAILAACFLAVAYQPAEAVDVEIGTGFNVFKEQHDGAWYQKSYPHWMDMNSTPLSFGLSERIGSYRYRAEFAYLGPLFIHAGVVPDGAYNPANVGCASAGECRMVVLQARGNTAGGVLSVSRDVPIMGVPFYAEAGVFAHIQELKVSIMETDGTFIHELERERRMTYGPVLGFGVRYSGVDVGIRYYYLDDSGEDDPITPAAQGAYSIMFKAYF